MCGSAFAACSGDTVSRYPAVQLWWLSQPSFLKHLGEFVSEERLRWRHSSLWVSLPPILKQPSVGRNILHSPRFPEQSWTEASEKSHFKCLLPAQSCSMISHRSAWVMTQCGGGKQERRSARGSLGCSWGRRSCPSLPGLGVSSPDLSAVHSVQAG